MSALRAAESQSVPAWCDAEPAGLQGSQAGTGRCSCTTTTTATTIITLIIITFISPEQKNKAEKKVPQFNSFHFIFTVFSFPFFNATLHARREEKPHNVWTEIIS